MHLCRSLAEIKRRSPCVLVLGNFDGVHRGHQVLLSELRAASRRFGLPAVVMTFEPSPQAFFSQGKAIRLTPLREKFKILQKTQQVDILWVQNFDAAFAQLSAQDFIASYIKTVARPKWLMVGQDFCFGAGRQGNLATLVSLAEDMGCEVHGLPDVLQAGQRISSSAVRNALLAGDCEKAAIFLGRFYRFTGRIVPGRQLGRILGFPTLNIRPAHCLAIAGIFIVQVYGLSALPLPGVASIGRRPSIALSGEVLLEIHLLNGCPAHAPRQYISVEFLKKLRDEAFFPDTQALIAAMSEDVSAAKAYFMRHACPRVLPEISS